MTIVVASFVCCNSDDHKTGVDDVTDTVKDGTWRVSYFYDSGADKTANYLGYSFVFGGNYLLTATKETNTYNGQWFVSKSTSDNDLYSTIFKISIGPNDIFENLNADWKVMSNTDATLTLKDDSKGETNIDYLTFEKIVQ
ncbi:hypothetical protein [Flavobacterium granuli]|uniref:Lipocalin-like domain-containing protein n=1 Tax=Flavobacterium granuli TaxID=280093 RepID=A0ABU1S476_9FLAO|nr:hypothetical protein [Flavobacterium granuli]MDR6845823.1 hypothetical protein [Flavobacterium granuli]